MKDEFTTRIVNDKEFDIIIAFSINNENIEKLLEIITNSLLFHTVLNLIPTS